MDEHCAPGVGSRRDANVHAQIESSVSPQTLVRVMAKAPLSFPGSWSGCGSLRASFAGYHSAASRATAPEQKAARLRPCQEEARSPREKWRAATTRHSPVEA